MKNGLITIIALFALASCKKSSFSISLLSSVNTNDASKSVSSIYSWNSIADSSQASLNQFWSSQNHYFLQSNVATDWAYYWPNAHGLDVLTDGYLRTSNPSYKKQMLQLIAGVYAKNNNSFLNDYYDDEEWMALACLRAYSATNNNIYLRITKGLWSDIKGGWSDDLGGGIWWRKDKPSKNTPSNMPAAILAARLYEMFGDTSDLGWAKRIYTWQRKTLYNKSNGLVYDNISSNGSKNTYWKFTYNQGTFLGAALELYKITQNLLYLNDAVKAADYTLYSGNLTSNGILKDEGGGDGGLFKGVFVRYFNRLIIEGSLPTIKQTDYIKFQQNCAETLWSKGTNKTYILFGSAWDVPPGNTNDFTTQLSGAMLFEALAELKNDHLVE